METGQYFAANGDVNRDLPIDYIKAKTWELRPRTKVPNLKTDQSNFVDESQDLASSNRENMLASVDEPTVLVNDAKYESETTV